VNKGNNKFGNKFVGVQGSGATMNVEAAGTQKKLGPISGRENAQIAISH
jgi:hypothetical protein